MTPMIRTSLLIISDTHGKDFGCTNKPLPSADVVIHCGDLSDGSKLDEFHHTIKLLKSVDAPLKLAIAGNHDFTMDLPAFEKKVAEATPPLDPKLVAREYGVPGEAKSLFEEAKDAGIMLLDEGSHQIPLRNGGLLKVFASPYTPALGAWGFQYHPERGHDFSIKDGVDVAITHGPPKGIMDFTQGRERAGCPDLFAAVARARPRVHCFGHIHEGWGARLVTWRDDCGDKPTHFTAIDNNKSLVIEKLASLQPSKFDTEEDIERKSKKLAFYQQQRFCPSSHCAGDEQILESGEQTLFVNASLYNGGDTLEQIPWLVDIELPAAIGDDER